MELWKEVEGTNGALLVSNSGRVKSLLRDGRILKPTQDSKGYLRLRVTIDREKRSYKVHRLVAMAFVDNPDNKPQVNHINGDKTDNRASNLEWVTNKENAHHAIKNGLWDSIFEGAMLEDERRKKPIIAVCIKTGASVEFDSVAEAERFIGSRHITDVLKGKRTKAKGYTFAYKEGGGLDVRSNT